MCLIHKNIHLKSKLCARVNHVRKLTFDDLKAEDFIDVRCSVNNNWFLACIERAKKGKYYDNLNCESIESMFILVRNCGIGNGYEWIELRDNSNPYSKQYLAVLKKRMISLQEGNFGDRFANIDINDLINKLKYGTLICDCTGTCEYHDLVLRFKNFDNGISRQFNKFHRIASPNSKSLYHKSLENLRGLHSRNAKTTIILGRNKISRFGGIYCKRIGHDENHFQCILSGFIKQFEFKQLMFIPKDLCQVIFKYYFIPSDKDWTRLSCASSYRHYWNSYSTLIPTSTLNDETFDTGTKYIVMDAPQWKHDQTDDIQDKHIIVYTLGSPTGWYRSFNTIRRLDIDMEKYCYTVCDLDIKCPKSELTRYTRYRRWYVVFCQKSQTIHLFEPTLAEHYCIKVQTLNNAATKDAVVWR